MKHFVFVKPKNDPEASWGLAMEEATLPEVRVHMNNRTIYPNPAEWEFKVIKGRELSVNFQAVVKF